MSQAVPNLMPGAEPFFYPGNSVGVLCLHGFMASPAEVRWMGAHLAAQGFTVCGPRLAGHGSNYREMSRQRWQDWYLSTLDAYHLLRGHCQQVFAVGHSMGGMLALLLAANHPVAGVAALATPVAFHSRAAAMAKWLHYLRPYTDQTDRSRLQQVIRDEQTRRGEPAHGRVRYDWWSTSAVGGIFALAGQVQDALPKVNAPLLVVYSEGDKTVSLENRDHIVNHIGSAVVERQTLQQSDHIITQDTERETVFAWVADFITRQSNLTA